MLGLADVGDGNRLDVALNVPTSGPDGSSFPRTLPALMPGIDRVRYGGGFPGGADHQTSRRTISSSKSR